MALYNHIGLYYDYIAIDYILVPILYSNSLLYITYILYYTIIIIIYYIYMILLISILYIYIYLFINLYIVIYSK